MAVIRSKDNAVLKRVRAAQAGKAQGELVLEGERLIEDALAAGVELLVVLVSSELEMRAKELERRGLAVQLVEPGLLQQLSSLTHSPGLLALALAPPGRRLGELALAPDALLLVVDGIADPGNLGALARSAEAAGAAALCTIAGGARAWNEKALRGSMGSLLRLPVVAFDQAFQAAAALEPLGFCHVLAATRNGIPFTSFDWSGRIALWVGSETGHKQAPPVPYARVSIPMRGGVESLNVTVAASLLLFAAGRAQPR